MLVHTLHVPLRACMIFSFVHSFGVAGFALAQFFSVVFGENNYMPGGFPSGSEGRFSKFRSVAGCNS